MEFSKSIEVLKKALSDKKIGWKEYGAVSFILEKTKECDICQGYGYVKEPSGETCDCVECKSFGFVFI